MKNITKDIEKVFKYEVFKFGENINKDIKENLEIPLVGKYKEGTTTFIYFDVEKYIRLTSIDTLWSGIVRTIPANINNFGENEMLTHNK